MEISINRALAELKLLDKRIQKAINESEFAGMTIGKKPVQGYSSNTEFEAKVQGHYDSANALIARRNAIKSAIVFSNALTKVKIADKEMTVAEAIERKISIAYDKMLLNKLRSDYNVVQNAILRKNMEVEKTLDKQLEVLYGKETKVSEADREMVTKPYLENNEAKMVDPLKLRDVIEKLSSGIDSFESEVDFVLSESNTKTMIVVPD